MFLKIFKRLKKMLHSFIFDNQIADAEVRIYGWDAYERKEK